MTLFHVPIYLILLFRQAEETLRTSWINSDGSICRAATNATCKLTGRSFADTW